MIPSNDSPAEKRRLVTHFLAITRHGRALALAFLFAGSALGQDAPKGLSDSELRNFVTSLQSRIDDPTVEIVLRERLALELATTLDRAAQGAENPETRRSLWNDAVATLDRFRETHRDQDLSRPFEVQAAVYLWARARMEMAAYQSDPANKEAKARAVADLETSIARLRAVAKGEGTSEDIVSKNKRFRLAQALADLAELNDSATDAPSDLRKEALAALNPAITEPSLAGFQLLLRASLLVRLNRLAEAGVVLDEASKLKTPIVPRQLLEGKVEWLTTEKKYAQALTLIENSEEIELGLKPLLKSKVLLGQWKNAKVSESERSAVETSFFKELAALRKAKRPEYRSLLLETAGAIKEPDSKQSEEPWDLLSEAAVASRDLGRAGELEIKGAERAKVLGRSAAAKELRLKAGAYFYQASRLADVEKAVGPILADPASGPARVKASLLIALSLGRAVGQGGRGEIRSRYESALKKHLATFPDDPSFTEVEWLLGKLKIEDGDRQGATTLWKKIKHGQPRWLDAQIELARLLRLDLDNQRLNGDRDAAESRFKSAAEFLQGCLKQAQGEMETNAIRIEMARLELTPSVGRPTDAIKRLDLVMRSVVTPEQRSTARWLRLVALAQLSRFVEAETYARHEARDADPMQLLEPTRLLDRTAAESDSDLRARRVGFLITILLDRLRTFQDIYTPEQLAEISLRHARSLSFTGNDAMAKRSLQSGRPLPPNANPDLLRDLAELYVRLNAYGLAEDVQRLRAKRLPAGSIPWFDACYGLALAYYQEGKGKEALHLIDATSILHPELGGSELKTKFIRLRQRLEPASGTP